MEEKEEARIKGKKIQNSKFKNLSACWRNLSGSWRIPLTLKMVLKNSIGRQAEKQGKIVEKNQQVFFLVLIQERTKENQGWKARPDGFPGGGTATRHNSPRLRRGSNSAAWAFPRHVPPPTHLRVMLLCRFTYTSNFQRFPPLRAPLWIPYPSWGWRQG